MIRHVNLSGLTVNWFITNLNTALITCPDCEFAAVSALFVFLGAFAKLQQATISFVMSVRPSVRLSVRPSVRPSARPSVCPPVLLSVLLSARLSVRLSVLLSARLSARLSVRLSVRSSTWNNSAPTGRIFMKFYIWVYLENLLRKFKFH
jgi:hypothetical protein